MASGACCPVRTFLVEFAEEAFRELQKDAVIPRVPYLEVGTTAVLASQFQNTPQVPCSEFGLSGGLP